MANICTYPGYFSGSNIRISVMKNMPLLSHLYWTNPNISYPNWVSIFFSDTWTRTHKGCQENTWRSRRPWHPSPLYVLFVLKYFILAACKTQVRLPHVLSLVLFYTFLHLHFFLFPFAFTLVLCIVDIFYSTYIAQLSPPLLSYFPYYSFIVTHLLHSIFLNSLFFQAKIFSVLSSDSSPSNIRPVEYD